MAVFLSALDEHRLHLVYDGFLLLSHRLTQGVALASGEVGELTGEKHHLLLIHRDAVGVFQVFLHARDVVFYLFLAVLTGDEGWDIVHWSRTVEGVHGDDVLECRGMQLAQVFLHSGRLKLESSDGASFAV